MPSWKSKDYDNILLEQNNVTNYNRWMRKVRGYNDKSVSQLIFTEKIEMQLIRPGGGGLIKTTFLSYSFLLYNHAL